jgi:hypothetical protein
MIYKKPKEQINSADGSRSRGFGKPIPWEVGGLDPRAQQLAEIFFRLKMVPVIVIATVGIPDQAVHPAHVDSAIYPVPLDDSRASNWTMTALLLATHFQARSVATIYRGKLKSVALTAFYLGLRAS